MFGNKDTDRIILSNLDDKSALAACNTNRYFRNKVCDENFFKNRIYDKYPEFVSSKLKDESWNQLFLKIVKKEVIPNTEKERNRQTPENLTNSAFFERDEKFEYVAKKNGNELKILIYKKDIKYIKKDIKYT
jgi:hypothetical protein